MIWVLLGLFFVVVAIFPRKVVTFLLGMIPWFRRRDDDDSEDEPVQVAASTSMVRWVAVSIAVVSFLMTSFVKIDEDKTGHVAGIYSLKSLTPGSIIAVDNMTAGPRAEVIQPGVHFSFLINVLNRVDTFPVLDVPDGQYAYLTAKDGLPLKPGQAFADPVPLDKFIKMVTDARYALENGLQRGPQPMALPPGRYRINKYLWDANLGRALDVEKGTVAVVKANVRGPVNFGSITAPDPKECTPILISTTDKDQGSGTQVAVNASENSGENRGLSVPIAPVGCLGIWKEALPPNRYYINTEGGAYTIKVVDTRLNQWEYKGGYKKRVVHLKIGDSGKIEQTEDTPVDMPVPSSSADQAVFAKVEGWDVPIEMRILVQVAPQDAPYVVAALGGLEEVEDRVVTPANRAITRDILGGMLPLDQPVFDRDGNVLMENGQPKTTKVVRRTQVLDLISNRAALEDAILKRLQPEAAKARVAIKEVRFGESIIPPEVLIPQQRQQLAEQMSKAYVQETLAQNERVRAEQARATADKQGVLVDAQIAQEAAILNAQAKKSEGQGEKDKMTLIADGQKSQAAVLGEERVMHLRMFELALGRAFDFADKHPEVITTGITNASKFVPDRIFTIGADGNAGVGAFGLFGELLNPANGGPGRGTDKK